MFQRAKIQDKCKQFTTAASFCRISGKLFQRAKIQDKCKQFTTVHLKETEPEMLFQRAKIQDKCKQFTTPSSNTTFLPSCFKEQRYKINASNSQLRSIYAVQVMVVSKSKDTR